MTIDTRHWAWCSLGPLHPESSGSLLDDHVQGVGLCMVKGSVTLAGIYRPAAGSPVSLAYSDGVNWIARVPRRLRVLSSTADPLRNLTSVSLGCLLAYHSNRRPPVETLQEVDQNGDEPEIVRRVAALPMTSAWVAQQILNTLGLTAAGPIPFSVSRIVDQWDMSAGYVEELGRIAQSDGYFAWINENEQVEFISKRSEPGTGQFITRSEIIDLTPANFGDLPGEAVYAKYTTTKLVPPPDDLTEDQISERNWERERVIGGPVEAIHSYTDAAGQTVKEFITYNDWSLTETRYDENDRVRFRETRSNGLNGIQISRTTFRYGSNIAASNNATVDLDEELSDVREEATMEWGPSGDIAAACGQNGPHSIFRQGETQTGWRVTTYDKNKLSGITKTSTRNATLYLNTPFGADAIAKLRESGEPVEALITRAGRLVPYGSSVRIRTERQFGLQRRPGQQERNRDALLKAPSIEQSVAVTWVMGSPASQTAIELSPPYVSDDRIAVSGDPPTYSVVEGNAQQQSLAYATTENRLLLGNRNGQGIQLSPLHMPARPFDPIYLRLNGCTAAYRVNGATWTIGADGIRCTADLLFWGAVDGTVADAWFPLPPGITGLPAPVAVTTNAAPQPANAMPIPTGFNPQAPDLAALFAALPTNTPAVPSATITPGQIVPPYYEVLRACGGVEFGAYARERYWVEETTSAVGGVLIGASLRELNMLITGTPVAVVPEVVTTVITGGTAAGPALLLRFDGGFTDSSLNNLTVANNGASIDTIDPKFGAGCGLFNSPISVTPQYLEITGAALSVGSNSWTLGAWVKSPHSGDLQAVAMFPGAIPAGLWIENGFAGWYDAGIAYTAVEVPDDEWCYIEVAKEGNILRLFVDGVKSIYFDMTVESFHGTNSITAARLVVGAGLFDDGVGGEYVADPLSGQIDDLFLLPGQALHTENFTPPTAAYPNP